MNFRRGDKVIVREMRGKVINMVNEDGELGVRVSVEGMKPAWWAVVPSRFVESEPPGLFVEET